MAETIPPGCEHGWLEFTKPLGSMLVQDIDRVGLALANPKDRIINKPIDDPGPDDPQDYLSVILNQYQIRLDLCVPGRFDDDDERARVLDNVRELRDNVDTECRIHYLSDLPFQFAASEQDVIIEEGYLSSDGFERHEFNNICDNPDEGVTELIERRLNVLDDDALQKGSGK